MSDEIDERKPGISPGAIANGCLLSRRAGSSRVHGAMDTHREFGGSEIIDGLISRTANGIVFCAQVRSAQDPMGFIEDLGLLFVSAQIRVRLKFPHDGSICTLNHGHISRGMHLQDFVVVDVGGEVSRLPCLSRPCSWQRESSSQAPSGGADDRAAN